MGKKISYPPKKISTIKKLEIFSKGKISVSRFYDSRERRNASVFIDSAAKKGYKYCYNINQDTSDIQIVVSKIRIPQLIVPDIVDCRFSEYQRDSW